MQAQFNRMISLGYGKYWRSDRVVGLMPIAEGRGPGQRTEVYVEDRRDPIVASRSEEAILADLNAGAAGLQAEALRAATVELLEAFHEFSPVLRRALEHEHGFDLEQWERRLGALLEPTTVADATQQGGLFD